MAQQRAEQQNEDENRTQEVESRKQSYAKDQAREDPEKTKRIEELKKKQNEK